MSIDFDSAALQTQQDEDEYDQEDYAREQELHKLLTDLPDDMLDDSRDSSPELECSTCSNKNTGSSPKSKWTQEWPDHARPNPHVQNDEANYADGSHDEYTYKEEAAHMNGYRNHPQGEPLPHTWSQDHQFAQGDYTHTSMGTENCSGVSNFSAEFESKPYAENTQNSVEYIEEGGYGDELCYEDQNSRNHFQTLKPGQADRGVNTYKASYNPHHPVHQQEMFNSQAAQQEAQFDRLQREFLDSTQQNADLEQLAQLQILKKAQQRQIEDLERKLEDSRRNMRYIEHQFAIVKDEKDGLAVSLKESSGLIKEAKEKEVQMQKKLKVMEQQVQLLIEKDQENMKKQRVADAAVDSMKQQMLELCRSDTLSRAREQHDRDLTVIKEQHEAALLVLQQKLDFTSQALSEQVSVNQRLQEHLRSLECQREEEQLERARVVNSLTQRLEESQQQCAKLLQTNSVQEMCQMQIKLQQAQSAKALSESMNSALQEDMADLKEQISLYESAMKHGVIVLDASSDWENHLSESCVDLGLKKTNRKNGTLHSTALAHLSDSKLPKDEALKVLRVEMQRCLGCLKGKRQKITQLQEELQNRQARINELQTELEEAKLNSSVRESSQMKYRDTTGDSQKEMKRLQEEKQRLQDQVEMLEKKSKELKQSEEKLKSSNSELCAKMREMIKELDQEKQEAAERSERIHQQYRDDVVKRVRAELMQEHDAHMEQQAALHQQQVQQLQDQLSEVNDKMLAVQECYISVCKEKGLLEERICSKENNAVAEEESSAAMEKLREELAAQHQASIKELKEEWAKVKETEVQQHLAQWKEKLLETEKTWAQKVEEAKKERQREITEVTCQTEETEPSTVSAEELDSRLSAQKQQLQLEADKVRRKAVEEAKKQVQRELQEKHLEDMAKQVEGAVTRAYNRWIEDLSSLPEYQASLLREKNKWQEQQDKLAEQRVTQALREAKEQWHKNQLEEHSSGAQRVEELQVEVAALKNQLEQAAREQAALLKAELAGARAAWNRDKQQEISTLKVRIEEACRTKLQEQCHQLEQAVQQARGDAELQRKELLLQTEAKIQQAVRTREDEWRCQHAEEELRHKQQLREEFLSELQTVLAEIQTQFLGATKTDQLGDEDSRRTSGLTSISGIIQPSCRNIVDKAVSQAKMEWKRTSEESLSRVLKEVQEQHLREINRIQSSLSQKKEQSRCRKDCSETVSKLQKKNQELQRHLEKACRQLQHSIKEHKSSIQKLKDEHEGSLREAMEQHLQQLEQLKRAKECSERSNQQQSLQQGLEEMKRQYLMTVEKIRGDMLRYVQESRERAAEMIRTEVQRERQDTARKMRHYYLTCLQELLEDGGKTTGAEKKIMNAASKLAAMAKVLETPFKSKSGKNYISPNCLTAVATAASGDLAGRSAALSKKLSVLTGLPDPRPEERAHGEQAAADAGQKPSAAVRTKLLSRLDTPGSKEESEGRSKPFLVQEAPERDEKYADWSKTSSDSELDLHVSRPSHSGRKVEPVKPFSVCAAAACEMGEFGRLTPDSSDLTVYQEISKKTPETEVFYHTRRSSQREPTPGSECEKQRGAGSRPLFSELRQRQQDSGFDSPFYQQK
ncbi:centrosomal protein of 152 kDa isoform 1-T1 [Menidia menidia]